MIDSKSSENFRKKPKGTSAGKATKQTLRRKHVSGGFTISYLPPKTPIPRLPYRKMKERVLGSSYDLSLVIAGDRHTREMNQKYRGKSYVPNVLSFPISQEVGEVFLNPTEARRQHDERGESYRFFVALLFIHSLLHLKGMAHGGKMERKEAGILSELGIVNTFEKKNER